MFKELYDLGFTKQILPAWYPGLPEQRYADAQDYHDAHQSTDFAHDLHFENNSFDFMVDANAVSKYMPQQSRVYGVSMREMLRVLRPGGKLLIIVDRGREQRRSSGKASAEEDRLRQLGVSYRLLHKPPTERKEYFAAVVTKPAS
jgi:SAM-dependent methyltransferase